jgi:NADPH-dependent curcumin reductase CurA
VRDDRNCQWRIARRPAGNVVPEDFAYTEEPVPRPGHGELLLKTYYLNLAPVMRMYMSGAPVAGESALSIGDIIHGRGVAEVVASEHPEFRVGDFVQGQTGWQTYKLSRAEPGDKLRRVPDIGLPYSVGLSALGMTGFSAYFGLVDCGEPRAGDTVVVSGAAGGVGSHAIQIAKAIGCRVIGIAGGPAKCAFIEALGCDAAIDYKADTLERAIPAACPDGVDVYFDNVGGETLEVILDNLAARSRIVLCGSISEYLLDEPYGLRNYTRLRRSNSRMQGFYIYNYMDELDRAETELRRWLASGDVRPVEHVFDGFGNMPKALQSLYDGFNTGSAMLRVRRGPYDEGNK